MITMSVRILLFFLLIALPVATSICTKWNDICRQATTVSCTSPSSAIRMSVEKSIQKCLSNQKLANKTEYRILSAHPFSCTLDKYTEGDVLNASCMLYGDAAVNCSIPIASTVCNGSNWTPWVGLSNCGNSQTPSYSTRVRQCHNSDNQLVNASLCAKGNDTAHFERVECWNTTHYNWADWINSGECKVSFPNTSCSYLLKTSTNTPPPGTVSSLYHKSTTVVIKVEGVQTKKRVCLNATKSSVEKAYCGKEDSKVEKCTVSIYETCTEEIKVSGVTIGLMVPGWIFCACFLAAIVHRLRNKLHEICAAFRKDKPKDLEKSKVTKRRPSERDMSSSIGKEATDDYNTYSVAKEPQGTEDLENPYMIAMPFAQSTTPYGYATVNK